MRSTLGWPATLAASVCPEMGKPPRIALGPPRKQPVMLRPGAEDVGRQEFIGSLWCGHSLDRLVPQRPAVLPRSVGPLT